VLSASALSVSTNSLADVLVMAISSLSMVVRIAGE
jgi:hypothetical protein